MHKPKKWSERLWDTWCIASIIGIWPRFIEPQLLKTSHIHLPIDSLPPDLNGLKIIHLSDLHWHSQFSRRFSKKIIKKVNQLKPDLIFFTGDFLCRSILENTDSLIEWLQSFQAKWGCYTILGNHDYAQFVTINSEGEYDTEQPSTHSIVTKGFKKLFFPTVLKDKVTSRAQDVGMHKPLIHLLAKTPFQLLHNQTIQVSCRQSVLNICGLGEYSLGRFDPQMAFKNYLKEYPGIVLSHHPDSLHQLKQYPGDLILSGHTHGGQVNLPGMWQRFTSIKYLEFKSGLKKIGQKWAYINRGLGGVMPFRWFASPELTLITLYQTKQ